MCYFETTGSVKCENRANREMLMNVTTIPFLAKSRGGSWSSMVDDDRLLAWLAPTMSHCSGWRAPARSLAGAGVSGTGIGAHPGQRGPCRAVPCVVVPVRYVGRVAPTPERVSVRKGHFWQARSSPIAV